jgi:Fic family protein
LSNLTSILSSIDSLKSRLDKIRPLDSVQLKKINEAIFLEYTYDSNRIEGNTLTLQETALVIQKGITISGKNLTEHLEAINHYEAVEYIQKLVQSKTELSDRILKDIHALVLRGIDKENAGKYRNVNVKIAGSRFMPTDSVKVIDEMENYFKWYSENKNSLHPVILSAEMHEKLVTIHPFIDGNGRTARLIMNLILLQNGFTIANIIGTNENRLKYYNALEKCQVEHSCEDFHTMVAETVKNSLTEYLKIAE